MAIQVTSKDLQGCGISAAMADKYFAGVNAGLAAVGATTPVQAAAFIAQCAHESVGFKATTEYASGRAYEGRKDLGNTQPGDGVRYRGRSSIQITGRSNYTSFTSWANANGINVDFVANPEKLAEPPYAFVGAAWYFNARKLLKYCSVDGYKELTRRINGGYNGLADRQRYFALAQKALAHLTNQDTGPRSVPPPVKSPPVAAVTAWKALHEGDNNDQVKLVQKVVGAKEDGDFGPGTAAKVKAWQAANGLTADGIVGAMTAHKMGLTPQ